MKYLIDTDIASFYLRKQFGLFDAFVKSGYNNLRLSIITIAELRVMPYHKPSSKVSLQVIEDFSRALEMLWPDATTWDLFSQIKATAIVNKMKPGDLDILQAALARQHALIVVTHNRKHFEGIAETEDWSQA